jgi:CDP-diacylglycerol---serine O-phosphatidyltransferase
MLNTQSEFGKELDSLCDMISFGVAPALIMYISAFQEIGIEGWLITALFPICGALRLARFNVYSGESSDFTGLPITAAGGILATMALYNRYMGSSYILMIGMIFLSYLMVSRIKYPSFKKAMVPKAAYVVVPLFLVAIAISAILYPRELPKVMFIPLAIYALYGVKRAFDRRRRGEERDEEPIEELK